MSKGFLRVQLPDGSFRDFNGSLFGDTSRHTSGEVVFQTGHVGYEQSLTDPSYQHQLLVLTYPLIGNYGVPDMEIADEFGLSKFFESNAIHVNALIVGECIDTPSHHQSSTTLSEWMKSHNRIGLQGVDTRAITELVRDYGTLHGTLSADEAIVPKTEVPKTIKIDYESQTFSPRSNPSGRTVLVVDCGVKNNQLRQLLRQGHELIVVNHDSQFSLFFQEESKKIDGLFVSNGPYDPRDYKNAIEQIRIIMSKHPNIPIFGICLGHQLLALAEKFKIEKMKYGNRGHNIPCKLLGTSRTYITSQNHGFAVELSFTRGNRVEALFDNLNDGSNEGLYWTNRPYFTVQFHPEAKSGPTDTMGLFSAFSSLMEDPSRDPYREVCNALMADRIISTERKKYRKVLILGSGGLAIGQSGEFDYSGSQAIKAFREEGLTTILINSNVATVQTSPGFVDKVYYLPITPEYVQKVIETERPDCIALSFGGQSALNCGTELFTSGVLDRFGVDVLGTPVSAINITEDRELFKNHIESIGEKICNGTIVTTEEDAVKAATDIGYPVLVRAAFALGGLGSGFAANETELRELLIQTFSVSKQVILDRSFRGWKELEYEIVRDCHGNIINVCNMENIDPLGVHTGESIVVAPSQTLSDDDHNRLREVSLKTIQSLGIVGECNIQFALNPQTDEYYIIEINARLSRSSALASKATGYPLAYIAAKLSLGYALDELKNTMTDTSACFEPSMDYCVVKVPRWDLKKFSGVDTHIGSAMKSVGEAMAISRSFEEALQSAIRMAGMNRFGLQSNTRECTEEELTNPTYKRIMSIATELHTALNNGTMSETIDRINQLSGIDKWFLHAFKRIVEMQLYLEGKQITLAFPGPMLDAKRLGFSDAFLGHLTGTTELAIRDMRIHQNIHPDVKKIDTVAAEFPCSTNYLYYTYATPRKSSHSDDSEKVLVLGSGVYKIGSSVEFDWCTVSCIRELRALRKKVIILNCNPETVSTDYDEADMLYFSEINLETALEIYNFEKPEGVIVSVGGQAPNNIALDLWHQQVPIIGTSAESIDGAENRHKFSRMLDSLQIDQPLWRHLESLETAREWCESTGYPCLVRPSYVLSGAAMNVAYSHEDLNKYLSEAAQVSRDHPVVVSKFISGAKEIEVDAVAQNGVVKFIAISEHVENAGVHSGDATLIFPPQDLTPETVSMINHSVNAIAAELRIHGPFNMQFIAKDDHVLVIECNLRVSRSFPFVSKTMGVNLVAEATKIMMGTAVFAPDHSSSPILSGTRVGVKVPQFSFNRLPNADILLGVEMKSTGEVACFGDSTPEAYLKAITATGFRPPQQNSAILLSIGGHAAKKEFRPSVLKLIDLGFQIFATHYTADYYCSVIPVESETDLKSSQTLLPKVCTELSYTDIMDRLRTKQFSLFVNITERNKMRDETFSEDKKSQGFLMRRAAIEVGIPVLTDIKSAKVLVEGLHRFPEVTRQQVVPIRTAIDCFTHYRTVRLPGLIDVHVHVRDPGETHKEDWETCTKSALAGGITLIQAMPNTKPALQDLDTFQRTAEIAASRAVCDYGLFAGACDQNQSSVAKNLGTKCCALKLYLNNTHNQSELFLSGVKEWTEHLRQWKEHSDQPVCCHAEGQTLAAVLFAHSLVGGKLHICHVSSRREIEMIRLAKQNSMKGTLTCEVAPHHLFLYKDGCGGMTQNFKAVKPPLGDSADPEALWENMDIIDCFATDHAPHLRGEKSSCGCPGFPGLETALPLLLTAVRDGRITLDDIILRYHTNPKKIFNLPDQPDTYVEVDLDAKHIIADRPHFSKCDWTPFAGMTVYGVVKRVVLRGSVAFVADHPDEWTVVGKVLVKPSFGKNVILPKDRAPTQNTVINQPVPSISRTEMTPTFKHFTTVDVLSKDHLRVLFKRADTLARLSKTELKEKLTGKTLGLFFMEASTRTRVSFEAAMKNLGGDVIHISATESSVQKGESLEDSIRCLSGVADVIALRHPESLSAERATNALLSTSKTLIVNAGDGTNEHPTQTLVDLYTIRQEIGTLGNIVVVLVGDLYHGRTVHSLAKALALRDNVTLYYVSPLDLKMPEEVVRFVAERGVEQHTTVSMTDEIIAKADVIYMTRLQKERFVNKPSDYADNFIITPNLLAKAKPTLRVLHPLPRGPEVSTEIDSDPRAAYFRQMNNGTLVRMALLSLILE